MFNKPKAVLFKAVCQMGNNRGLFEVGEDGTVLMSSLDCRTGQPTGVVLSTDPEELKELIGFLVHCLEDHQSDPQGKIDNEPSEQGFDSLMQDLKKNLH